ncbi:uncharacterized tRNA/rRNA methyltransferase slr1673 [Rhodamnia argentea]|uniref:Uncharacterized tRNA/rRNA methyltransferase slr1673 n=1 Tax=Rhodamnia argentea TaxID=178133 RepID=A0A8B8QMW1_9MYRT|nr:uncharacterized tRNA/rRNA methyltransferase slr1673 [Rhodamnia argentea]
MDMSCFHTFHTPCLRLPVDPIPISGAKPPPTRRDTTHFRKTVRGPVKQTRTPTATKSLVPNNVELLTSTSNPFVKHCVKLRQSSSYRHSHSSALVVGTTPIREICNFQSLKNKTAIIDCLLLLDKAQIPDDLEEHSVRLVRVSSLIMEKLSGVESAESIEAVALMRMPSTFYNVNHEADDRDCRRWFASPYRILVLDGIQDPGNLGTLLRSAAAFNWDGVFLLPGCCDPFNDKALRASRGASFQLSMVLGRWSNLEALRNEFQMKLLAGHPESKAGQKLVSNLSPSFVDSLANVPVLLVLGSEGRGLSEESESLCELVSIPMAGKFESLNVSVAGGIFLYMLQPQVWVTRSTFS